MELPQTLSLWTVFLLGLIAMTLLLQLLQRFRLSKQQSEREQEKLDCFMQQLRSNTEVLDLLQTRMETLEDAFRQQMRPLLAVSVEKVERQRYTFRLRNEGLGPAIGIFLQIQDSSLRNFNASSPLSHDSLGPNASSFFQLNMMGLSLPSDFLVLRYDTLSGERCVTHLRWVKGALRNEFSINSEDDKAPSLLRPMAG